VYVKGALEAVIVPLAGLAAVPGLKARMAATSAKTVKKSIALVNKPVELSRVFSEWYRTEGLLIAAMWKCWQRRAERRCARRTRT
jgi:hypothetical protein